VTDKLEALIAAGEKQSPAAVAAAIRKHFHVFEKPVVAPEPPTPEAGQVWRNKQSDRLVKITEIRDTNYSGKDVVWEALSGRGPKIGKVWFHYWTSRFEFIGPDEDTADNT
jgi:hypothetical protein